MTFPPLSPAWSALAGRVVAEYRAAIGDDLVAITMYRDMDMRFWREQGDAAPADLSAPG